MKIIATNKKAKFDYDFGDHYQAGIVLQGCEIKSIKTGKMDLVDAYADVIDNEVYLEQLFIATYNKTTSYAPEERRRRKLLLKKNEIKSIQNELNKKRCTVILLSLFLKDGLCKAEIAIAYRKSNADKRNKIKSRDLKNEGSE